MEKLAPGTVKSHSPSPGFEPDWESSELSPAVSCGRVESGSQVDWTPSRASPRFCWDTGNVPVPFTVTTIITLKENVSQKAWFYV